MKLIFFSDTHGKHEEVQLPSGDVLIFCGDMCPRSTLQGVVDFAKYIKRQPHKYKIVIAGNHDAPFENAHKNEAEEIIVDTGAIYLNDSGVTVDGINFWGYPVQPEFLNWSFNRFRGEDIKKHWDKIPLDTDVLITHGPPVDILDQCLNGVNVGCADLLLAVNKVNPMVHAFGHIHEGYGVKKIAGTTFMNASNLDARYQCVNKAITFKL